jgi:hypothetical protein
LGDNVSVIVELIKQSLQEKASLDVLDYYQQHGAEGETPPHPERVFIDISTKSHYKIIMRLILIGVELTIHDLRDPIHKEGAHLEQVYNLSDPDTDLDKILESIARSIRHSHRAARIGYWHLDC